jgi:hypothetical protein
MAGRFNFKSFFSIKEGIAWLFAEPGYPFVKGGQAVNFLMAVFLFFLAVF